MEHGTPGVIQRTLILTLGKAGTVVGERLAQMFDVWDVPPVVAVRHLGAEEDGGDVIATALREVSRLAHRAELHRLGYRPDRLDELVVWVVGRTDEPLVQVARIAAERAALRLGNDPLTVGMVLCDDPDTSGAFSPTEEEPGCEMQACTAFTGPCYVASLVNEMGLTLDDTSALYDQVARFIVLHVCTPLRDAPAWMEQASGWDDGLGYASFGVTWLAWPGAVARARAAHRLAQSLLPLLTGSTEGQPDAAADADGLLREAALAPPFLAPRLTPPAAVKAARLVESDLPAVTPWALLHPAGEEEHPLVVSLEAALVGRSTALEACSVAWEASMQASLREHCKLVRSWVAQALDAGGLERARALVASLLQRLGEWAAGAEQRHAEYQEDLPRMAREAQVVRSELMSVLNGMPRRDLKALLRLLRNPLRWVWLWLRWRRIRGLRARYLRCQAATLETRLNAEQMTRACGVYWGLGSELQSISQQLDHLERGLSEVLAISDEVPGWPGGPLLSGDSPDELLARVAERYLPSPRAVAEVFLGQLGPLSRWWREGLPDRATVGERLMQETAILAGVPLWEVIRCRYTDIDAVRDWIKEVAAQSSPLWRWDPATVCDEERARTGCVTVLLSSPCDAMPLEEEPPGMRVIPLARADWLAVVTLRWGVPVGQETATGECLGSPQACVEVEGV